MNTTKIYYYVLILLVTAVSACNDGYLEKYPLADLSPETYFTNENELNSYTNSFYEAFPSGEDIFYTTPEQGDDEARNTVCREIAGTRVVPNSGGDWTWSELRGINFFLENSFKCEDEDIRIKYDAVARFFRAYFYFKKVVKYGDVPWYDHILETDAEDLFKARDTREFVFERMLEDIDYAIENLSESKDVYKITKWTALALKSRMCLFEGTFRKYHGGTNYEAILDECISASENLIDNSGYQIYKSDPSTAYHELFVAENAIASEVILTREYAEGVLVYHRANYYLTTSAMGAPGVQKSLINSYLMIDGSRFTDISGYQTMQFYDECQNRDPRMAQTIRTPGYMRMGESFKSVPDFSSSVTGYQFSKYVLSTDYDRMQYNDVPIFRYAEILLNFAEAKAERNTLTQSDIDKSIKLLRDRVGMPNLNMAYANANPCPYMVSEYPNVSTGANKGVILEIRRERRIELIKEGFRYSDILRWKEGKRFERTFYGMYFPGVGDYDLDNDGNIDITIYNGTKPSSVAGRQYQSVADIDLEYGVSGGRIRVNTNVSRVWNEARDYLYPIPVKERLLNPNLTQNFGWDDGL